MDGPRTDFATKLRDVRNELLIFLYLDIHVGHDKKPIYSYLGLFKVYTAVYKCTC